MRDQRKSSLSIKESYTEELLPAKAISVILGLHDRSKDLEERRWNFFCKPPLPFLFLFLSFSTGNISGSAKWLSTRTSQTIRTTLHCWNLVSIIVLQANFFIKVCKLIKFTKSLHCRRACWSCKVSTCLSSWKWTRLAKAGIRVWWVLLHI